MPTPPMQVGSVQLEYARLHAITRDPRYAAVPTALEPPPAHPRADSDGWVVREVWWWYTVTMGTPEPGGASCVTN